MWLKTKVSRKRSSSTVPAALIFVPFVMNVPYSLETIMHPSRLLVEPGLLISGGGPINALLGNPGGANSLPIWLVSPILLVLIVSLFSSTHARRIAEYGVGALVLAVVISSLSISTHGNEASSKVWTGPVLVLVTLAAVAAGTVLLDRLRETLVLSHIHYRAISSTESSSRFHYPPHAKQESLHLFPHSRRLALPFHDLLELMNPHLYVKAPFKREIIRSIDGLGGFSRTSATSLGVVWRVTAPASRLMFVGADGVRKELEAGEVGARTFVPAWWNEFSDNSG